MTPAVLRFTVPVIMPSLNKQLSSHWAARKRLKDKTKEAIDRITGADKTQHRNRRAIIGITVYSNAPKIAGGRARRLDADNLIGGQKPLVDSLKTLGFIFNDSPKWAAITYTENRDKVDTPRTEIEIIYNGRKSK